MVKTGDMYDEVHTHEFAEAVVEVLKEPSTQVVLAAAGMYVFKLLTKPLDDWVETGVKWLYKSLASAFQKQQISEFFIQLPSGEQITVGPNTHATITVADGKVTKVQPALSGPLGMVASSSRLAKRKSASRFMIPWETCGK